MSRKRRGRAAVRLEPEPIGPARRDVERPVLNPVESCAAPLGCEMWRSAILHGNERRDCAQRVSGRQVQGQCRVTEREGLTVGGHHVTFRPRLRAALEEVPIRRRQDHTGPEVILQVLGPAGMIEVAVAHDGVLDRGGIEPQLLQSSNNLVLDRVVEDRIDDDNPGRCGDCPRRVLRLPDEIQVVEDFYRFGMPLGPVGRALPLCRRRLACPGRRSRCRRVTQAEERRVLLSSGRFGGCHVRLHSVRARLRSHARAAKRGGETDCQQQTDRGRFHSALRSNAGC